MKIILLKDVGGVGKHGEVKEVSDGYALNLLIPNGKAKQATKDALSSLTKLQAEIAEQKAAEEEKLKTVITGLRGARIEMKLRATEKGGLFKTVAAKEIAQALQDQKNVTVDAEAIQPIEPVKTTGDHIIKISAAGADSEIMLKVVAA